MPFVEPQQRCPHCGRWFPVSAWRGAGEAGRISFTVCCPGCGTWSDSNDVDYRLGSHADADS